MYTKYIKYICLLSIFACFIACDDDELFKTAEPEVVVLPALNAGSLDFSNYVAVGASFTAGFTDGGLFIASQENSFPNILSKEFAKIGGGDFIQPLMNDNSGGILVGGNVARGYRLTFNSDIPGPQSLDAFLAGLGATAPAITTEAGINIGSDFNNFGIPGAKSWHLVAPGYAAFNPYYARIASASTASVLGDAMNQNPTFFTLSEVGGNDVLGYALSGGDGSDLITPSVGPPGVGFDESFGALVATLTSGGAKGIVTNVPNITDLPHFTTVPFAPLDPSNEAYGPLIPLLNNVYGALNQIYAAIGQPERSVVFSESAASAVVIKDETLTDISVTIAGALSGSPQFAGLLASFGLPTDPDTVDAVADLFGATYGQTRQATAEDLLVLPSSSIIGQVNTGAAAFLISQNLPAAIAGQFSVEGVTLPLADKWVLLPSEQTEIFNATDAYNTTIAAVTSANPNVALVDFKSILAEATSGIVFDDFTLTTNLVTGGLVSLDGFHLTAKGYALMANKFLEAMDTNFDSNFTAAGAKAKAVDYPTNYSPTLQ